MGHASTDRGAADDHCDQECEDDLLLVVNTADSAREVDLQFVRGPTARRRRVVVDAGGFASVDAPAGVGPLAVSVETDDGARTAVSAAWGLPMVVVRDRAVQLC